MSRNIADTRCRRCSSRVVLSEEPRPITEAEAGYSFRTYEGMVVANAECSACSAKYLAWVTEEHRVRRGRYWRHATPDLPFFDLSFRSTFNDEPGDADLPEEDQVSTRHELAEDEEKCVHCGKAWLWDLKEECPDHPDVALSAVVQLITRWAADEITGEELREGLRAHSKFMLECLPVDWISESVTAWLRQPSKEVQGDADLPARSAS